MAIAIIINNPSTLISSPNTSIHRFPSTRSNLLYYSRSRSVALECSNLPDSSASQQPQQTENGSSSSLNELLSVMVGESVTELLNKEENRGLLDGLEKAEENVQRVKRELAELEKQEIEVNMMKQYVTRLESQAAEIEECQKEIAQARVMVEEAERVLSTDSIGNRGDLTEEEKKAVIKNEERLESIKAASIAAIVGTIIGLPFSLAQMTSYTQLVMPSAITFISCALFGVTFRYVIRRDLDDSHLKTGAAAAFGVVKGLAMLDGGPPLALEVDSLLSHAFIGAVNVSENLLIFLFAAVGLEYCIKMRILSPFPIERPDSNI